MYKRQFLFVYIAQSPMKSNKISYTLKITIENKIVSVILIYKEYKHLFIYRVTTICHLQCDN